MRFADLMSDFFSRQPDERGYYPLSGAPPGSAAAALNTRTVQLSRAGTDVIASALSEPFVTLRAGETVAQDYCLPLDGLAPGEYDAKLWIYFIDPLGRMISYDVVPNAFRFAITQNLETADGMKWVERRHGLFRLHDVERISPGQP